MIKNPNPILFKELINFGPNTKPNNKANKHANTDLTEMN